MTQPIWRMMDANFNRAREGLRVCEDVLRFIRNDAPLTQQFKNARHELSKIQSKIPAKYLIEARESFLDVGKKSWIQNQKKLSYVSILIANLKRIEESLRVLEECSKIVTPNFVRDFQALRFRIYELEKKTLTKF